MVNYGFEESILNYKYAELMHTKKTNSIIRFLCLNYRDIHRIIRAIRRSRGQD